MEKAPSSGSLRLQTETQYLSPLVIETWNTHSFMYLLRLPKAFGKAFSLIGVFVRIPRALRNFTPPPFSNRCTIHHTTPPEHLCTFANTASLQV